MEPGQIWCDQPIYLPARHGLKIERVNPKDDSELDFAICGRTADTFNHPPVHSLHLESTEAAVVAKAKRDRPVIILGGASATEVRPSRTTLAETIMVVPVYGADQYEERERERIAYYEFSNAFYLPALDRPRFDEGFARLDHIQPVMQRHLVHHRGMMLSSDALDALVEWFIAFTTGRIDKQSILLEYRQEMLAG
jgi:hypothetical protein